MIAVLDFGFQDNPIRDRRAPLRGGARLCVPAGGSRKEARRPRRIPISLLLLPMLALLAPAAPGGALAQGGESPDAVWARWERTDAALRARQRRVGADLLSLARADSARTALEDSLCRGLAWVITRADSTSWAAERDRARWARNVLFDRLITGDPCAGGIVQDQGALSRLGEWNADGALTLSVALALLERERFDLCRDWLLREPAAPDEEPFAVSLLLEAELEGADTLAAGARAESLLQRSWPEWCRADLEEARIRGALAAGDTLRARRWIDSFIARGDRRGFYLLSLRSLARLRGREAQADSLTWRIVREYPGGSTARGVLRAWVVPGQPLPAGLDDGRKRLLLASTEARSDLDRFRVLEEDLRPRVTRAGADSLILRGGRVAYKAREYARITRLAAEGTWRPRAYRNGEWGLILARALRNTAQTDSMERWYGRVAQGGTVEDRATALWEWAREMEDLRRLQEADSLYGRFLALNPGDRRAAALLRRGICRFGLHDLSGAGRALALAEEAGDAEEKGAARFWEYRVALEKGDSARARSALIRASQVADGYYKYRALSALRWAERAGAPGLNDPQGYWKSFAATCESPDLAGLLPARIALPAAPDSARIPEQTLRARDRLLIFRRYVRGEWALLAKEDLEEAGGLGAGAERVRRLHELGLPDLATRAAVRGGLDRRDRYPTPFAPAVAEACQRLSLAPELVWAIMRSESFFESSVVSGAGAIGLMQLVRGTAEATGSRHGIPSEPLRSPWVNLLLGTAHLRDLAEQAPGDWPVVAAAYNAGMHNATRWIRPGEDPDFYIEMIGYRETREYVRRVFEAFWTYREILRGDL